MGRACEWDLMHKMLPSFRVQDPEEKADQKPRAGRMPVRLEDSAADRVLLLPLEINLLSTSAARSNSPHLLTCAMLSPVNRPSSLSGQVKT
eukprot:751998-Hanusia_phi.AAC.3